MAAWIETALILFVNLLISFAAGCATCRESYIRALKTPQAMIICSVIQFVVRPGIVFGMMIALGVPDDVALGCMLCAMAPGGNGSNLLEIIFRGNIELGIVCTLCSSLCASVAIPLGFYVYAKRFSERRFTFATMPWVDICFAIACIVVGASAGAILRYHRNSLGQVLEYWTASAGLILLVAAVLVALLANVRALHGIPTSAWMACTAPCPCSLICSYYPARLSGMSVLDSRTVATEVGECNIGVACAGGVLAKSSPKDVLRHALLSACTGMPYYSSSTSRKKIDGKFFLEYLCTLSTMSYTSSVPRSIGVLSIRATPRRRKVVHGRLYLASLHRPWRESVVVRRVPGKSKHLKQ